MTTTNTPNLSLVLPVPGSNQPHSTATENANFNKIDTNLGVAQYRWSNDAQRTAQTGMRDGDEGFQTDIDATYKYMGAWQLWNRRRFAFTPVLAPDGTMGSGGYLTGFCTVAAGIAYYTVRILLGTGFVFPSGGVFYINCPYGSKDFSPTMPRGQIIFQDTSAGSTGRYIGVPVDVGLDGSTIRFYYTTATTNRIFDLTLTDPFAWAVGDSMSASFSYAVSS